MNHTKIDTQKYAESSDLPQVKNIALPPTRSHA